MASGVDSAFNLQTFKQGLNISVNKYTGDDMEFEVKGLSCAVRARGPAPPQNCSHAHALTAHSAGQPCLAADGQLAAPHHDC